MSIWLRGGRFGGVRCDRDDEGEVKAVEECGWFDTPALAAARVVAVLLGVQRALGLRESYGDVLAGSIDQSPESLSTTAA